ncbi:MAG: hypothetical protein AUJ48_04665 [Deltaproteobacteria bacterium CG1_02_45_11]|nr:MAG: hypothetical protein AUJ48_04665 [Deltaproteobacteria bacterium CG1_02_45_11]HCW75688.1 hypothetical protein [Candidatus Neomarinimicrobiota bacterium]
MIKALMPVNTNLESSIALRYAKKLSRWIDLMLHDIHIVEADRIGPAPGSGWTRNTWENALIETASQEIHQFLEMENLDLKRLGHSEILIGDRTEKLIETLEEGEYQLFIEGALPTFNLSDFYFLVHSLLYRAMPCPALIVKNIVELNRVAVLVGNKDYPVLISAFLDIFSSSGIEIDLIDYVLTISDELAVRKANSHPRWLNGAASMFGDKGVMLKACTILEGPVSQVAQYLRTYGLVAASLPRNPRRHYPKLELLARVSAPVLICWL